MIQWEHISHFDRAEFDDPLYPGSGDLIDPEFLILVVRMRVDVGWPMISHARVGGCVDVDGVHGHADNSYHLVKMGCKAIDFHFVTTAPARRQYYEVGRFGFGGLGAYFDWHWNDKLLPIGFHVDLRPKDQAQRWTRKNGEYFYLLQ